MLDIAIEHIDILTSPITNGGSVHSFQHRGCSWDLSSSQPWPWPPRLVLIQRDGVRDLLSLGDAVPQEGLETSAGAPEMERGERGEEDFPWEVPHVWGI